MHEITILQRENSEIIHYPCLRTILEYSIDLCNLIQELHDFVKQFDNEII